MSARVATRAAGGTRSLLLTAVAGGLALVPVAAGPTAAVAGLPGLAGLVAGVSRGNRRQVRAGAVGLYAGVLLAGMLGAPTTLLALGTVGVVVAWDGAEQAVDLGRHPGSADAARPVLVHTAITAGVAVLVTVGSYLLYRLGAAPAPTVVVVVLLTGGLLLHHVLVRTD
ncbi:DUF7519 family protein [Haloglomus salinum]|uniref:DUF7519 family protein n=1 Tax=Haloglomus salinum TaxID=2962673 RepID=UPI0020C9B674|nr:hypothetical protein [Haloglomus salinum]